jgi:TM2 domain-containing membrane protein YozV
VRSPTGTKFTFLRISRENGLLAALRALLLGGLGAHKFYLGRTTQGVLYLLFCWTFIPFLLGIMEGVVYLSMSDASFSAKYS